MLRQLQRLLVSEAPGSPATGLGIAALWVVASTALVYPLKTVAPVVSLGVVYLVAVLVVSANWGVWMGLATGLASALAFNFFHLPPTGAFTIQDAENYVALVAFMVAAVVASSIAQLARSRAAEAGERRREADLSAEMARLLLRGSLEDALPTATRRLAQALELPSASIELRAMDGDDRRVAFSLRDGTRRLGTLLVPSELPEPTLRRLQERVVPSLEALLTAALERDDLQGEAVEAAALRRGDVVKTALLRTVSHDLRSPVTAIWTAGEALRDGALEEADRQELASVITGEADRLARLVDKLLDLSRLEAGAAEPRRDWCSLDEVVRGAVEHLTKKGAPITVALDPDLPLVRADAVQLERVFVNLLENARRYSGDQPVNVRGRVAGGRVLVRVIDHGPGVPPELRERIFEPFEQGDARTSHTGSGLGLAIVRGFVEANGGRVWPESLPGQGSAFVVELPVPEPESTFPVVPAGSSGA